jgi:hypothetical protein
MGDAPEELMGAAMRRQGRIGLASAVVQMAEHGDIVPPQHVFKFYYTASSAHEIELLNGAGSGSVIAVSERTAPVEDD